MKNDKHGRKRGREKECACIVVITGENRLVKLCGDREKKLRLVADGIPRGGKYEWSIIRGSNKAKISGSNKRKFVRIIPLLKSQTKNDVTIKVTYSKGDIICEETKKLTVFKPTSLRDTQQLRILSGARRGYVKIIHYTVLDQWGDDLTEAGMKPRERLRVTTPANHNIGRFSAGNFRLTDNSGSFNDYLHISRRGRPVWPNLYMVIDQIFTIGRCRVRHNTMTYRATDATVQNLGQ